MWALCEGLKCPTSHFLQLFVHKFLPFPQRTILSTFGLHANYLLSTEFVHCRLLSRRHGCPKAAVTLGKDKGTRALAFVGGPDRLKLLQFSAAQIHPTTSLYIGPLFTLSCSSCQGSVTLSNLFACFSFAG